MAVHYFSTSGTVAAKAPTAAQLDTSTTVTGDRTTSVFTTTLKNVTLLKIIVLKVPGTADALTITDNASSPNTLLSLTVPTSAPPSYEFGGIPTPSGGIVVTTTQATGAYLFVVDATGSVA